MGAHHVWLRGVPANPPRAIAFVVKEALGLRRTPNVLPKPATTEALVLCQAESDTATALRHAAVPASAVANQLERRLGASVTLEARAEGCWDVDTPPVDGRSWGRWVRRRHPASALAQVVEGDDGAHGCGASRRWGVKAVAARRAAGRAAAAVATAEGLMTGAALRVLWAGATEPRGLRAALGGFDDHFSEGTYSCAGCGSQLYTAPMKFACGCGWPAFWTCIDGAAWERRDPNDSYRGEGYSNPPPNERHCVNSSALTFRADAPNALAVRCEFDGPVYMRSYSEDSETCYTELKGTAMTELPPCTAVTRPLQVGVAGDGASKESMRLQLRLRPFARGQDPHIISETEPPADNSVQDPLAAALAATGFPVS